jgi:23S rRNA (cytosine1962-C5)-methyltransferase
MQPTANSSPRLRLRVSAAAEKQIRAGHPWVYSDSIREQNREGAIGELAVVFDRADQFLAAGFFDPDSPIRLRVLHAGKPLKIDHAFWTARLESALARRKGLFDGSTTGYRIINGESDGWPGLVLDRYADSLVMKVYTAAWMARLDEIAGLFKERLGMRTLAIRASRNIAPAMPAELAPSDALPPVVFLESGLKFEADVWRGQKTGFFLDQRENRRLVESFARGREVLNAFSFSGGFSIYAARGGAKSVTDLDISAHALDSARRNFKLNWPDALPCAYQPIQTDAFEWLAGNPGRKFDLVILDPPSFAKRERERTGAIRAYSKLASDGLSHLRTGGILVACSCSAHVSAEEFLGAVRSAVRSSGRQFEELRTTGHAPDHHASFREAEYLKSIYLRLY